jgi:hypothetical protein
LPEVLLRFGVPAQRRKAAKAQRKDMMSSKATLLQSTARQIIKVIGGPENGEH